MTVVDKDGSVPFNMPLSLVLGKMPQKTFTFQTVPQLTPALVLPADTTVKSALHRVFALLDVGSKRYLTNKVDRSVTGLVAQQQCVGILHTPLADVAVLAQSHLGLTGVAVAMGEQPIKGLISNAAQGRMTVGEALTNLMWAKITALGDVKASCNWMWASKLHGEGPRVSTKSMLYMYSYSLPHMHCTSFAVICRCGRHARPSRTCSSSSAWV